MYIIFFSKQPEFEPIILSVVNFDNWNDDGYMNITVLMDPEHYKWTFKGDVNHLDYQGKIYIDVDKCQQKDGRPILEEVKKIKLESKMWGGVDAIL